MTMLIRVKIVIGRRKLQVRVRVMMSSQSVQVTSAASMNDDCMDNITN